MLHKQLAEDGMLQGDSAGKRTRVKVVDGKGVRMLWIPRTAIDGPSPANVQQKMELQRGGSDGFAEVQDDDLPFEKG